jgi:hypothetical protein
MALGLLLLFSFTSCGTIGNLSESIGSARDILGEIQDTYAELKPSIDKAVESTKSLIEDSQGMIEVVKDTSEELKEMNSEAFISADKDKSGDLDWKEKLAYWVMLGGGAAEIGRRKLKSLTDGVSKVHDRVDYERGKRKDLEGQVRDQAS